MTKLCMFNDSINLTNTKKHKLGNETLAKNYSKEGNQNLLTAERANNFSDWKYEEIKPFLEGNILEVGSGIGTYSKRITQDFKNSRIVLSDIDINYVADLNDKFSSNPNVSCIKLDLSEPADFTTIKLPKVDSIVAIDVLEHVEDDIAALRKMYDLLPNKGKLVILVPAHKFLFNTIDKAVFHYRRYTKQDLLSKISKTRFKVKKLFFINSPGIVGWFLTGNILKKQIINESAMGFFDYTVPIVRFIEKHIFFKKIGNSIIAVLEKNP